MSIRTCWYQRIAHGVYGEEADQILDHCREAWKGRISREYKQNRPQTRSSTATYNPCDPAVDRMRWIDMNTHVCAKHVT